ncbi:MAG: archaeal heat shock protein Hsp20 [Nitrososphaeraceae archaeon]
MTTTTQVGHDSATLFSLGTFNHAGLEKLTQAFLDDLPPPLSILSSNDPTLSITSEALSSRNHKESTLLVYSRLNTAFKIFKALPAIINEKYMSSSEDRDIEPFNWFNRFFGSGRRSGIGGEGFFGFPDVFRGFDEMRRQMERAFEDTFKNIEAKAPTDLVREYETSTGGKVREYGPFVYGYSMTIGPDGKPKVREFGNVKSPFSSRGFFTRPLISSEREPLADVTTTDKEVKVVVEMPGVSKENIKINVYDNSVEVTATDTEKRKYHEVIEVPAETDIETATSTYKNGILEITFKKKEQTRPKGKQVKIV